MTEDYKELVELWECPNCGFSFPTEYEDDTAEGGHSCPSCAESRLTREIQALTERLERAEQERDELKRVVAEINVRAYEVHQMLAALQHSATPEEERA